MFHSDFLKAFQIILELEGGYSDVSGDLGGKTNFGITATLFKNWLKNKKLPDQDIKTITIEQAQQIYYEEFWKRANCDNYNFPLNLVIFDAAVHSGPSRIKSFLQYLQSLNTDQKIALDILMLRFIQLKVLSDKPSQQKFKNGWYNRLHKLFKAAGFNE